MLNVKQLIENKKAELKAKQEKKQIEVNKILAKARKH
jgi:hypothetical protein